MDLPNLPQKQGAVDTEGSKKDESGQECPVVAQIPWVDYPIFKYERIQGVSDIQLILVSTGKTRANLYKLLNEIFPFYLPTRYHTMDCKSLSESSLNSEYWANTAHFLMCNQAHGHIFFHHLQQELQLPNPDFSQFKPAFDEDLKNSSLKGRLEQCDSPEEFLLEPWVLLQLPFQPVLLHQWAVALLAEVLTFKKELAPLYYLGYGTNLRGPMKKLITMCNKMQQTALDFFSYFTSYAANAHLSNHKIIEPMLTPMLNAFPEILPIIKFVLSYECKNAVCALKYLAWMPKNRNKVPRTNGPKLSSINNDTFVYSYLYWNRTPRSLLFANKEEEDPLSDQNADFGKKKIDVDMLTLFVAKYVITHFAFFKKEKMMMLVKLVPSCVEELVRSFDTNLLLQRLKHFDIFEGCGVIGNVHSIYMDALFTEAIYHMMKILIDKADLTGDTYLYALKDAEAMTKKSLSSIVKMISQVTIDNNWRYQKIMERVKATCFSPHRTSSPDYKLGADNIAEHFQERIKNLVFKMIETQFKTLKGPFTFFLELQFVQYMLPCFVASFLDMEKDKTVSSEVKEKYLKFVHLLVSNYERYTFSQQLTSKKRKIPFAFFGHACMKNQEKSIQLSETIEKEIAYLLTGKLGNYFKECKAFDLTLKGIRFLFHHNLHFGFIKDKQYGDMHPWGLQLFMFNTRIQRVFRDDLKMFEVRESMSYKVVFFENLISLWNFRDPLKLDSFDCIITLLVRKSFNFEGYRGYFDFEKYEYPDNALTKDLSLLPAKKLIGVCFYKNMANYIKTYQAKEILNMYQGPHFPHYKLEKALWCRMSQDYWMLKQLAIPLKATDPDEVSPLATFELAKSNLCYEFVLKALTPEGKVPMSRPGEITFFPVQHCRWCGQVEGVAEFRVCPECLENPEYPDANFFCSEKCEKESLDSQHTEEHVRFLLIKCELST